jgi:predicted PurR-regulated permease PerM
VVQRRDMLSKRRVSPYFLLALLVVLAFLSFRLVRVFLSYILVGLFLAYLTYPTFAWIQRRVRNRSGAALIMLLALTVVVLVPLGYLIVVLVEEMQAIVLALRVTDPQIVVDGATARLYAFFGFAPPEPGSQSGVLSDVYDSMQDSFAEWLRDLPGHLVEGILGVFILVYVLYYSYTDGPRVVQALRELLPLQPAHRDLLFREVGHVTKGVMYGTVLLSVIQAILAGIGFVIFGVPNPVFWSVLVFILALLPIVGAPLIWFPWGLYFLLQGDEFNGIGLLVYSAVMVNGLEHLARPKLIATVADIHPVVVLLGVVGGIAVFGFVGFILGPLVLSIFVTVLNLYRKEFAAKLEDEVPAAAT